MEDRVDKKRDPRKYGFTIESNQITYDPNEFEVCQTCNGEGRVDKEKCNSCNGMGIVDKSGI